MADYTNKGLQKLSESFIKNNYGNLGLDDTEETLCYLNMVSENPILFETLNNLRKLSVKRKARQISPGTPKKEILKIAEKEYVIRAGMTYDFLEDSFDLGRNMKKDERMIRKLKSGMFYIDQMWANRFSERYLAYANSRNGVMNYLRLMRKKDPRIYGAMNEFLTDKRFPLILKNVNEEILEGNAGTISLFGKIGSMFVYELLRRQGDIYRLERYFNS
jgi:hypothetical protein